MVACYRDERGVARMVQGVDFIQLGSKVGPGLAQIASQFEARLAGPVSKVPPTWFRVDAIREK